MKEISIFIVVVVFFGFAGNSAAVSPTPSEELNLGQTENVCTINVVYSIDREKGKPREESSSALAFEASLPKKDVLERVTKYVDDKLTEWNVSEFKIECKFLNK